MSLHRQDNWRALATDWFASFLADAGVPSIPDNTLWEDVAFGALKIAEQQGQFLYNPQSPDAVAGLLESYGILPEEMAEEPDTSGFQLILPGVHTGPAQADPAFHDVLVALGLVVDGSWTPQALPTLWRGWANMTKVPPEQTDLFRDYAERAAREAPVDVIAEIKVLAHFTPEALAKAEDMLQRVGSAMDSESLREKAAKTNAMNLEFLIAQRWRAERGWLSEEARARVCCLWFDGLADRLGEALAIRLFPQSDLAERSASCDPRPLLI